LRRLLTVLTNSFEKAIKMILDCEGRVVVTGMGKSGLIGKKIAATLASTRHACALPASGRGHPRRPRNGHERGHGDSTLQTAVKPMNWQECYRPSNGWGSVSLRSPESRIHPGQEQRCSNRRWCKGGGLSSGARADCKHHSDAGNGRRACRCAFGPARLQEEDFACFHPGGALGKKLLLRVRDLMHTEDAVPVVSEGTLIKDAIYEISSKKWGSPQ